MLDVIASLEVGMSLSKILVQKFTETNEKTETKREDRDRDIKTERRDSETQEKDKIIDKT